MISFVSEIKAVAFDYGNTLVEYGPRQLQFEHARMIEILERIGPVDAAKLMTARRRQIAAPLAQGFVENDMRQICAELILEACGLTPTDKQIDDLIRRRRETFIANVTVDPAVLDLLDALRSRYRIGLLSNYPCGVSIRSSLSTLGISPRLQSVVVSGEVGFVKPHPVPFEVLLGELDLPPTACVYVGDNWLADVQGAKRLGMRSIHTTEHEPYEKHTPQPHDHRPDATITQIQQLRSLLLE